MRGPHRHGIVSISALFTLLLLVAFQHATAADSPEYERVYELRPDEGVYAYARMSPDGRYLAYASQERDARPAALTGRTLTVVDLQTKEIVHAEPGMDAYWSSDGSRMIYSNGPSTSLTVSIRHHPSGEIVRNVAPEGLGDYYSWAVRDGKDLIVTILGNYYYLDGDRAVMPYAEIAPCPTIGRGLRPLVSHDGRRISTFVNGTVVIRNLDDCNEIIDTGIQGGKADFSWDGRYVAMHTLKTDGSGYEIQVVDLQDRTVRTVTDLPGSALFPSWLKDGRLFFNYDSDDYRGFILASNFLRFPAHKLSPAPPRPQRPRAWNELFPQAPSLAHNTNLVMVWSTWSAHSPEALVWLQVAQELFKLRLPQVGVFIATEPTTRPADAIRMLARYGISLPEIACDARGFLKTEAPNQIPAFLLFRDGAVIDSRLGAQTVADLTKWSETWSNTYTIQ